MRYQMNMRFFALKYPMPLLYSRSPTLSRISDSFSARAGWHPISPSSSAAHPSTSAPLPAPLANTGGPVPSNSLSCPWLSCKFLSINNYVIILRWIQQYRMRVFWDFKRAFMGLPFALPLIRGIVVFPLAFVGTLYALQYGLTSDVYFDEHDGEAREAHRPKLH